MVHDKCWVSYFRVKGAFSNMESMAVQKWKMAEKIDMGAMLSGSMSGSFVDYKTVQRNYKRSDIDCWQ
jgi:hypothetical protein